MGIVDSLSVVDGPIQDAVILGAGFSRAICAAFPLTDELGSLAVAEAESGGQPAIPHPEFRDGNFETWLSRLAEDQPYLAAAQNLDNRARFTRISHGIRTVLASKQAAALRTDAPSWLYELLSVLHARRATVLTLNYDNFIECAVDSHYLYDWPSGKPVAGDDVLNDLPPSPELPAARHQVHTFGLLKLHGSLSWYWSPDDATGATLQRWLTPGAFGAPVHDDDAWRRRVLPGREPFIVPPAATKSAYYRNPVTRELWSQAFEALRSAERIIMIGYSLPAGDLTLSGMIGDAVAGRHVTFELVNPDPAPVRERLARLGVREDQIGHVQDGERCVEQFARRYRDQQARAVVERLRLQGGTPAGGSLLLSWATPTGFIPAGSSQSWA